MKTTKKWGRRLKSRHHNRTAGERKEAHLWFLGVYLSGIVVGERESVKSSSSVLTQTVEAPQDAGLKGDAPHSWPHTHPHDHTHKHTLWKVKNPQTSLIPTLTAEPTHTHTHTHTPTHTHTHTHSWFTFTVSVVVVIRPSYVLCPLQATLRWMSGIWKQNHFSLFSLSQLSHQKFLN